MTKKRSLWSINEHFESFFNAVFVSAVVVQNSLIKDQAILHHGLSLLNGIDQAHDIF